MEIHRGTIPTVSFTLPNESTSGVSATYSKNGSTPTPLVVSSSAGLASADLPYQDTDGIVSIVWSFTVPGVNGGTYSESTYYEVVTPLLTKQEVKDIVNKPFGEPVSDSEATLAEAAVRHVINAHTGQSFGKMLGTYKVRGNGARQLLLPRRLLSIESVNGQDPADQFFIGNDGWSLTKYDWGVPPTKADAWGLHMDNHGVIHNPNNIKLYTFYQQFEYEITGTWGWDYVPSQVREAAKLLVADYSDPDSEYRDRYLTSMTAADWRIQFHAGAFVNTGNARADQLLSDYVLHSGWGVI